MEYIKKAVGVLDGDQNTKGTAFLVDSQYVFTSKHLVEREEEIFTVSFPCHRNTPREKILIDEVHYDKDVSFDNPSNDIAILKLKEPIYDITPLTLDLSPLSIEGTWISYGFPGDFRIEIETYKGNFHDILSYSTYKYDLRLHCKVPYIIDYMYTVQGASGSPIIKNNKVIGVLSNEGAGAIIGAASLVRSKSLIKKYLNISDNAHIYNPFQKVIELAVQNTKNFILGFPPEVQYFLHEELDKLGRELVEKLDDTTIFLEKSRYPSESNNILINEHIEQIIEIILLLRSMYGNIRILPEDDFANLRINSDKAYNISLIYAENRHQAMAEILLHLHNKMIDKSAAQIYIECGKPIPPNPVIFDNCSTSAHHNLCKHCGKPFKFEGILKSYLETEDQGLIKGIEPNNFKLLNKAKIICGNCIRKIRDDIENTEDIKKLVGSIIND